MKLKFPRKINLFIASLLIVNASFGILVTTTTNANAACHDYCSQYIAVP